MRSMFQVDLLTRYQSFRHQPPTVAKLAKAERTRVLARSDREMTLDGEVYQVRATTPEAFDGVDIALFAGTEGEKGAKKEL